MRNLAAAAALGFLALGALVAAQAAFETDVLKTSAGDLRMSFLGHGTLMFELAGKTVHVDPWARAADYSRLPKADVILVTHQHGDHLDPQTVESIRKETTAILLTAACEEKVKGGVVMKNGDVQSPNGIRVEAVPAYNLVHQRDGGQPFHPKGEGNGYVITFGDKRVYVAGDSENVPEMKALQGIDVAFLPMNLPYTMTPEMVADAALAFRPKVLYPYHFGDTDTSKLVALLKDKGIEVRIRNLK
jgi:L-ascorbate metabolism protein UlaG (beta-lactamase superfamily)